MPRTGNYKIANSSSSPIYDTNKNMLILRNIKIYPGMYHHTITIGNNGQNIHTSYKLSDNEITNHIGSSTAVQYNTVNDLPQYNETQISGEVINAIIRRHNTSSNITIKSTLLNTNRCQIHTDIELP